MFFLCLCDSVRVVGDAKLSMTVFNITLCTVMNVAKGIKHAVKMLTNKMNILQHIK